MAKFNSTDNRGGRPRGARTKLAQRVLQDLLDVWQEPSCKGSEITKGIAALRVLAAEDPEAFAKLYASILPKEFHLGTLEDTSDEDVDTMIEKLKADLLEAGIEPKLIELKPPEYSKADDNV